MALYNKSFSSSDKNVLWKTVFIVVIVVLLGTDIDVKKSATKSAKMAVVITWHVWLNIIAL